MTECVRLPDYDEGQTVKVWQLIVGVVVLVIVNAGVAIGVVYLMLNKCKKTK